MRRRWGLLFALGMVVAMPVAHAYAPSFTDVPQSAWYRSAVDAVTAQGIMTGVSAGRFDPGGYVTRAQLAQVIARMEAQMSQLSGRPNYPAMLQNALASVVTVTANQGGQSYLGSGIVVQPGIVLSVYHIANYSASAQVTITLQDGSSYPAQLLSGSQSEDLAIYSFQAPSYPPALSLATATPAIGANVFAIGNPISLSDSVTRGIVSFASRSIEGAPYVQTDAAINPGNSGGPLLNGSGQVVGLIDAKIADASGLGLAIPATVCSGFLIRAGISPAAG